MNKASELIKIIDEMASVRYRIRATKTLDPSVPMEKFAHSTKGVQDNLDHFHDYSKMHDTPLNVSVHDTHTGIVYNHKVSRNDGIKGPNPATHYED